MLITWDDSTMSVGNDELDKQHKTLVEKINELNEAAKQGAAETKMEEMINFLADYAIKHFNYEEDYFKGKQFPEAAQHCEMHKTFLEEVTKVKQKMADEGVSSALVIQVSNFVADWVVTHIKKADHRYCEFVKTGVCPA
jgi:hemerythrin